MKFYEDIQVGERRTLGTHTFTAEDIKRFAARFDPQAFHLDEEAAKRSHFGALCASGWHTAAVCMRLIVDSRMRETAEAKGRGEATAKTDVSPGFTNLRWPKPVYVGDVVTYTSEIVQKRESASRPEWGILSVRNVGTNQNSVEVFEFTGTVFVERRR